MPLLGNHAFSLRGLGIFCAALGFVLAARAVADDQRPPSFVDPSYYESTGNGDAVTLECQEVTKGSRDSCVLPFKPYIAAVQLASADTIAVGKTPSSTLLLIKACGPSRPATTTPTAFCAAGFECNLVWLDLNDRGVVSRSASIIVDSCLHSMESSACQVVDGRVHCSHHDYSSSENVAISFDLTGRDFVPHVARTRIP